VVILDSSTDPSWITANAPMLTAGAVFLASVLALGGAVFAAVHNGRKTIEAENKRAAAALEAEDRRAANALAADVRRHENDIARIKQERMFAAQTPLYIELERALRKVHGAVYSFDHRFVNGHGVEGRARFLDEFPPLFEAFLELRDKARIVASGPVDFLGGAVGNHGFRLQRILEQPDDFPGDAHVRRALANYFDASDNLRARLRRELHGDEVPPTGG
jgi:hypothetical protein